MPILPPSTVQTTINSLVPSVIRKVENRVNDTAAVVEWLVDALIEITMDQQLRNDLIELEVLGPQVSLTIGQQEYPDSTFVASLDVNQESADYMIWQDPPTNQIRIKLLPTTYQETDKFVTVNSLPVKWYRYGYNIGFYPIPDQTYQVQGRYLKLHPINLTAPGNTVILLSQNWFEILKLSAAQKGFLELEEYEKADSIGRLLRGDPDDPKKSPGMLYGRKLQREREAWRTEQRLAPMIHNYSHWPRG